MPDPWPNPAAINRDLHAMGFQTMISAGRASSRVRATTTSWRRRAGSSNSRTAHRPTGCPTTAPAPISIPPIPQAARWYWNTIRDNILSQGFDAIWADETEPDLPPNGSYFQVGPGTGYSTSIPCSTPRRSTTAFAWTSPARAHPLARRLLGSAAQWHHVLVFRHLSHLGHPEAADSYRPRLHRSGMAYWTNDIGGWQYLPKRTSSRAPSAARSFGRASQCRRLR